MVTIEMPLSSQFTGQRRASFLCYRYCDPQPDPFLTAFPEISAPRLATIARFDPFYLRLGLTARHGRFSRLWNIFQKERARFKSVKSGFLCG
jgi:hypothetical protein